MKKLIYYQFLLVFSVFVVACHESPVGDTFTEDQYANGGTEILASNIVNGFFDLAAPDDSFVEMDLASSGDDASSTDVSVTFKGAEAALITSPVPATGVRVTFNEVLSALGITVDDVAVGDNFIMNFQAGSSLSGSPVIVPASCFSGIGGTFDYVSTNLQASNGYDCPAGEVTGTVTFEDQGSGTYLVSDLGFGQYESTCWNDAAATSANATIRDVCNQIISGGLDQYGLEYIWVINSVDGADLSLSWSNNYGDSGDAVVSRTDGTEWPPLFTN